MKNLIILILSVIFYSCDYSSSKTERKYESANDQLFVELMMGFDGEKIGLLSIIKQVPYEQVNSVISDYLTDSFKHLIIKQNNPEYFVNLVDSIALKNNLSRELTASIIFSYRYEMITKEEIVDEYLMDIGEY